MPALSAEGATGAAPPAAGCYGNTPGVPQLDGDMTVFGMNAGGDFLPAAICSGLCSPSAPA